MATIQFGIPSLMHSQNVTSSWLTDLWQRSAHAGCLVWQRKIYILYLTSTHKCVSRVRTHRDKYTNSQNTLAETRSPHTQCDIYSHCTVFFMQIVTISVQCFEICSRLQYISLCSCLCCVLPGALTLLGILKSRQPISSSSHHLKGNECHLIEIGSLSLHWSNIADVYVLFGAAFFLTPFWKCTALHWPLITLRSLNAKMHLMFKTILCTCYKFSVHISFAFMCPGFV